MHHYNTISEEEEKLYQHITFQKKKNKKKMQLVKIFIRK